MTCKGSIVGDYDTDNDTEAGMALRQQEQFLSAVVQAEGLKGGFPPADSAVERTAGPLP